ncbi:MAG: transcriptional repressor [Verrucomicrobiae bacterium]|nr:transcriptional repressor [Verrucomicrobiae bacterium]
MLSARRQAAKERFLEFLARQKLRLTGPRRAIIDCVFSTSEHFTAEQLLGWARAVDPTVSRATVYRTLPLLTASGLVREMDFGRGQKYYDPNYAEHPEHNHIICVDCNKIFEFEDELLLKREDEISFKMGFKPQARRLQLTASCEELRRRGICKNKDEEEHAHEHPAPPGAGRGGRRRRPGRSA